MNVQRCSNGHMYDKDKSEQCPYCPGGAYYGQDMGAADLGAGAQPAVPGDDAGGTRPYSVYGPGPDCGMALVDVTRPPHEQVSNEGATRAVTPESTGGMNPAVGWLVCIEGKMRGQHYSFKSGNNCVGAGSSADVQVVGDDTISKANMAYIIYEPRKRDFFVSAGQGTNPVYVNDEHLMPSTTRRLEIYDRIRLGQTTLMFVPLCSKAFAWD